MSDIAEKSARATARGRYVRWLAQRFGSLDLLMTLQGEDRVSLRKVYVPLRIDTEDRSDESMPGPEEAKDEPLPGRDALDVIAEQPFVAVSGRPGSGKTTLIQAIIDELASEQPSDFRRRVVGNRGILPISLILRDYQDELEQVQKLDDLLNLWWKRAEQEALDKGHRLDVPRLRASYAPTGDGIPLLLLFDGIDEVGGPGIRLRMALCAKEGLEAGHRVVMAGRPQGFSELRLDEAQYRQIQRTETRQIGGGAIPGALIGAMVGGPAVGLLGALFGGAATQETRVQLTSQAQAIDARLRHLQPFGVPQIKAFVERFYRLRDEWRLEREQFVRDFDTALSDAGRPHLLTLARRPHFLTLMALVHANDRRMPHGRADLYRRIIDLYLIRQTQQRRLHFTHRGEPMPHWDEREVRRALGYLAWRSQLKGAEAKGAEEQRDKRQVIWTRPEMEQELRDLLEGANLDLGRFSDLKPEDAPRLLDYFLHPTGLLVDPAEDRFQFAHLSFQEYLCAEYVHGRAKSRGSRRFLDAIKELLYENLGLPGWDEVGLLLLCIHAAEGAQTDPNAHLELIAELNPANLPQAKLIVTALTGQELDFASDERQKWLALAIACALVQPAANLAVRFKSVPEWFSPGRRSLLDFFAAEDPFSVLRSQVAASSVNRAESEHAGGTAIALAEERWRDPSSDLGWSIEHGPTEARSHALLTLASSSGWMRKDWQNPSQSRILEPMIEQRMLLWIERQQSIAQGGLLYRRQANDQQLPYVPLETGTAIKLDEVIPQRGDLLQWACAQLPLDACLLKGEDAGIDDIADQCIHRIFNPVEPMLPPIRLAVGLYEPLIFTNAFSGGRSLQIFLAAQEERLLGVLSHSITVSLGLARASYWSVTLSGLRAKPKSRARARWALRSLPYHWSADISLRELPESGSYRPMRIQLSRDASSRKDLLADLAALSGSSEHKAFCSKTVGALNRVQKRLQKRCLEIDNSLLAHALEKFGRSAAALDWFNEQAEDPDLMRRRGLRPGQPLPSEFGLFDDTGRLNPQMPRAGVVRLREWVDNDDAVLGWFFPGGLSDADDKEVREQLHILHHYERPDGGRGQPWSPKVALDAVLADWPEDEPFREVTLEAAERDLIAALDELLPPES